MLLTHPAAPARARAVVRWSTAEIERAHALDGPGPPLGWARGPLTDRAIDTCALDGPSVLTFRASLGLFGDGPVVLVGLSGRAPGSTGVLLAIEGGGRVLLAGDAIWQGLQTRLLRQKATFPAGSSTRTAKPPSPRSAACTYFLTPSKSSPATATTPQTAGHARQFDRGTAGRAVGVSPAEFQVRRFWSLGPEHVPYPGPFPCRSAPPVRVRQRSETPVTGRRHAVQDGAGRTKDARCACPALPSHHARAQGPLESRDRRQRTHRQGYSGDPSVRIQSEVLQLGQPSAP